MTPLLAFLGPWEIAIVFAILLLLFGANKIPTLARGLVKSVGEFKRGRQELEEENVRDEKERRGDGGEKNREDPLA